jgi:hypothetical protein
MRQIRFAAIAFVGLVVAIASSFIDPGTFFHGTLSFTLCSVLGLTSNLCYANLARNSGDRAVAALPPTEQTQNLQLAVGELQELLNFDPGEYEKKKDCDEKPQPQDGETWGDPHLVTFDHLKYDHHAVGEFILAKSTDGTFEIQVREAAVPSSSQVALNTAAAMKVGNTRVAFYVKDFPDSDTSNPLRVDGKPTVIQGGSLSLPGGGTITQVRC